MADYETTLNKFRGLVAQLQEANKELRSKQLESETKAETPTIELFDFKAKFAETKAFAKVNNERMFLCLVDKILFSFIHSSLKKVVYFSIISQYMNEMT